jgi:hypothetical protein
MSSENLFYNIIRVCFAQKINRADTAISLCLHPTSQITVLIKEVIEIVLTKTFPAFMLSKWTLHSQIRQPLVFMLNQLKPVHGLTPCFLASFNIIIFYTFVFQRNPLTLSG